MSWADEVRIETPEQIDIHLQIAGLGSRFVAKLLDLLLIVVIYGLGLLGVTVLLGLFGEVNWARRLGVFLAVLLAGTFLLFVWGWNVYFEVQGNGQTPGKRWAGVRVVSESGGPVTFQAAAVRNLLAVADMLPPPYLLGSFLVLLSPRGQRLGDIAAGTIVTRERRTSARPEARATAAEFADPTVTFTNHQLSRCTADDRRVLGELFRRFGGMDVSAREALAGKLAGQFARRLGAENPREDPVVFLASLYRDLQEFSAYDS